jgi:hypothetical protein
MVTPSQAPALADPHADTIPAVPDPALNATPDAVLIEDHGTDLLFWLLRFACAGEFIGHGAFGIITKSAWVPYFTVVGIPEEWAYRLMPLVGSVDVFVGFLVLLKPIRGALLYMAVWGVWTALLRPLSGESFWETVERAPNYLVPAALLCLRGFPRDWRSWRVWLQ